MKTHDKSVRTRLSAALVAMSMALGCGDTAAPEDPSGADESPSSASTDTAEETDAAETDAGHKVPSVVVAPDAGGGKKPTSTGDAASAAADAKSDGGAATAGDASAASADAGVATANSSDAGASSAAPSDGEDACGPDAQLITGTTRTTGAGETNFQTSGAVEILSVRTLLKVPSKPSPSQGTLFLWPGLQPLKMDATIGYGVLQPVLTWGTSCAPGALSASDGWWISGEYVGSPPGAWSNLKCEGGPVMRVEIGDQLDILMSLAGTIWTQTITNKSNGKSVSFARDMKGQKQQWLINSIELTGAPKPVDDVIFSSMVFKLSDSQPKSCVPNVKGANDYFSPPRASSDGKTCCISKIILRASGVKASSPDTP